MVRDCVNEHTLRAVQEAGFCLLRTICRRRDPQATVAEHGRRQGPPPPAWPQDLEIGERRRTKREGRGKGGRRRGGGERGKGGGQRERERRRRKREGRGGG